MKIRPAYDSSALRRALITTLDHEHVEALRVAAETTASVLMNMDLAFPDPDKRTMAHLLRTLAADLIAANQARDFLETGDRS